MRQIVFVATIALALSGCAMDPWVKPYEREALADPIMAFSPDSGTEKFRAHVFDVLQGSPGAELSQGGGCGCK